VEIFPFTKLSLDGPIGFEEGDFSADFPESADFKGVDTGFCCGDSVELFFLFFLFFLPEEEGSSKTVGLHGDELGFFGCSGVVIGDWEEEEREGEEETFLGGGKSSFGSRI